MEKRYWLGPVWRGADELGGLSKAGLRKVELFPGRRWGFLCSVACLLGASDPAGAASPTTGSFNVQITIQADCQLTSSQTLNFGTQGVLVSALTSSAILQVTCTPSTPYDVGLDNGLHSLSGQRRMLLGSGTINYNLYQGTCCTTPWGNTIGTNTLHDTGTGSAISYTVSGHVPSGQATPAAGTYTDTVTVTMTF